MADPVSFRREMPSDAVEASWRARDGAVLRRFDWPAPGSPDGPVRGALLFLGGRGDILEKYLEAFAHLRARGWSVTWFDWRGQGGSGRLGGTPRVGHIDRFETYVDDLAAFYADWTGDGAGPHVVLGHSMGGHLVLRALAERAISPDAVVLSAPMLGLRGPFPARLGEVVAHALARLDPTRRAWRSNERPGTMETRQELLTHDPERYADELWWYAARPELMLGPPSWTWVAQAFTSTRMLAASPALAAITAPVLMLVPDADALVSAAAARAVAARMPTAELIRFGRESAHEILREVDPVRDRALAAIAAFLDRVPRR